MYDEVTDRRAYVRCKILAIYFHRWSTIVMAREWGFLTNHGRVLLCIAHDPGVRLRDIAAELDITCLLYTSDAADE